jgi:hypothetical protein
MAMIYCSLHFLHLLHDKHKYAFVCVYSGMLLVVIGGWMRERSVCVFLDELQKCTLLLLYFHVFSFLLLSSLSFSYYCTAFGVTDNLELHFLPHT